MALFTLDKLDALNLITTISCTEFCKKWLQKSALPNQKAAIYIQFCCMSRKPPTLFIFTVPLPYCQNGFCYLLWAHLMH